MLEFNKIESLFQIQITNKEEIILSASFPILKKGKTIAVISNYVSVRNMQWFESLSIDAFLYLPLKGSKKTQKINNNGSIGNQPIEV